MCASPEQGGPAVDTSRWQRAQRPSGEQGAPDPELVRDQRAARVHHPDELSVGAQHAVDLGDDRFWLLRVVDHAPGVDRVEARVFERQDLRIGHPSGILPLAATVVREPNGYRAVETIVYRTARRLMEGWVRVPEGGTR